VHGDGLGSLHSLLSAKLWSPSYVGRQLRNFLDCFPPENAVKGSRREEKTRCQVSAKLAGIEEKSTFRFLLSSFLASTTTLKSCASHLA
jgi:hypothetical protein